MWRKTRRRHRTRAKLSRRKLGGTPTKKNTPNFFANSIEDRSAGAELSRSLSKPLPADVLRYVASFLDYPIGCPSKNQTPDPKKCTDREYRKQARIFHPQNNYLCYQEANAKMQALNDICGKT